MGCISVFVTNCLDGLPISGVMATVQPGGHTGFTDSQGFAQICSELLDETQNLQVYLSKDGYEADDYFTGGITSTSHCLFVEGPPQCPTGQHLNSQQVCVNDEPPGGCPPDTVYNWETGNCESCPPGQHPNSQGVCVNDEPPNGCGPCRVYNPETGQCQGLPVLPHWSTLDLEPGQGDNATIPLDEQPRGVGPIEGALGNGYYVVAMSCCGTGLRDCGYCIPQGGQLYACGGGVTGFVARANEEETAECRGKLRITLLNECTNEPLGNFWIQEGDGSIGDWPAVTTDVSGFVEVTRDCGWYNLEIGPDTPASLFDEYTVGCANPWIPVLLQVTEGVRDVLIRVKPCEPCDSIPPPDDEITGTPGGCPCAEVTYEDSTAVPVTDWPLLDDLKADLLVKLQRADPAHLALPGWNTAEEVEWYKAIGPRLKSHPSRANVPYVLQHGAQEFTFNSQLQKLDVSKDGALKASHVQETVIRNQEALYHAINKLYQHQHDQTMWLNLFGSAVGERLEMLLELVYLLGVALVGRDTPGKGRAWADRVHDPEPPDPGP